MENLKKTLKAEIIAQYGSVNEWAKELEVTPVRFYNFLKGTYNPTLKTLNVWLKSVGLELSAKKK